MAQLTLLLVHAPVRIGHGIGLELHDEPWGPTVPKLLEQDVGSLSVQAFVKQHDCVPFEPHGMAHESAAHNSPLTKIPP